MDNSPNVNIVVPLYNEEQVFHDLVLRLKSVLDKIEFSCEVILIDDGSTDATFDLMKELSLHDTRFTSVSLSRNFGHQLALTAAMKFVNAKDAVMIIDGDLQDPPELIEDFYKKIEEGYDVVYAIRKNRKESLQKRFWYSAFYKILDRLSNISIPVDAGDFCMMSRRVVDQLNIMPEESRFIRGMRSWLGYKQIGIEYEREERQSGDSKYSFKALVKLAFNGIFNFSESPIRIITRMGIISFAISFIYLLITLAKKYFFGEVPEGFTAIITLIVLFGSVQLIAIGLIGEYVLRIFFQVKSRPLYIIDKVIRNKEVKQNG